MILRPIEERDLEFVRMLRNENRLWFNDSREITTIRQLEWFLEYINNPNDLFYVIEVDGERVGTIGLQRVLGGIAELGRIMIAYDHRRKGYARAAVRQLLRLAPYFKVTYVTLDVKETNGAALSLYHSVGFRETGTRWMQGWSEPNVMMSIKVAPTDQATSSDARVSASGDLLG